MASRKQGSTDHPISFTLRLTADNSLATGKTPTVELSKDGGAYAAASGALSEVGSGQYVLAGDATDRDTLGELWAHITATGCVEQTIMLCDVVVSDVFTAVYASGAGQTVAAERKLHDENPILFSLKLSSDHFTPATGKTPVLTLIENGVMDSFPALGTITEVGNGIYAYTPHFDDLRFLADIWAYITADDCDSLTIPLCSVVFNDPFDNLTIDMGDTQIDTQWTLVDYIVFMGAALAGKISGAEGTDVVLRSLDDAFDALHATVDANGNRTAIEYYP